MLLRANRRRATTAPTPAARAAPRRRCSARPSRRARRWISSTALEHRRCAWRDQHVGETRARSRSRARSSPRRAIAFGCERADRFDRVVVVVARRARHARGDRGRDDRVVDDRSAARTRRRRRPRESDRPARTRATSAFSPSASATDWPCARVDVGEQHFGDTGRVDELAAGTRADGADTDDEHSHRNSGASSSRQPPLVGGTPPLPRKRAISPINPATPRTRSTRRKAFISAGVYRAPRASQWG